MTSNKRVTVGRNQKRLCCLLLGSKAPHRSDCPLSSQDMRVIACLLSVGKKPQLFLQESMDPRASARNVKHCAGNAPSWTKTFQLQRRVYLQSNTLWMKYSRRHNLAQSSAVLLPVYFPRCNTLAKQHQDTSQLEMSLAVTRIQQPLVCATCIRWIFLMNFAL